MKQLNILKLGKDMCFLIYFSCTTEDFSSLAQEAHFFSRRLFQEKSHSTKIIIFYSELNIFYFGSIFRGEKTAPQRGQGPK